MNDLNEHYDYIFNHKSVEVSPYRNHFNLPNYIHRNKWQNIRFNYKNNRLYKNNQQFVQQTLFPTETINNNTIFCFDKIDYNILNVNCINGAYLRFNVKQQNNFSLYNAIETISSYTIKLYHHNQELFKIDISTNLLLTYIYNLSQIQIHKIDGILSISIPLIIFNMINDLNYPIKYFPLTQVYIDNINNNIFDVSLDINMLNDSLSDIKYLNKYDTIIKDICIGVVTYSFDNLFHEYEINNFKYISKCMIFETKESLTINELIFKFKFDYCSYINTIKKPTLIKIYLLNTYYYILPFSHENNNFENLSSIFDQNISGYGVNFSRLDDLKLFIDSENELKNIKISTLSINLIGTYICSDIDCPLMSFIFN
jgi:hypothetical protein